MRKLYRYWTLTALALLGLACDRDELLDLKPFQEVLPSTVEEYRLLMDQRSRSRNFSWGRAPMYNADFFMTDEYKIPDGEYGNYSPQGFTRLADAAIWAENFGTPEDEDEDWTQLNNHILIANIVIEAMEDPANTGDAATRQLLIAEAQVHRAYAYWALVNLYSKQYDPATAATDLGVPIKQTSEFQESFTRATVQEVYDQILEDLNGAISSGALPAGRQSIAVRPNRAAAYAILAKTHLSMGNYQEALEAANTSLQNYSTLLDYTSFFRLPFNFDNEELLMLKEPLNERFINGNVRFFVADELLALFDENDQRVSFFTRRDFFSGELVIDKGSTFSNTNFFISPTVAEMYLIRAECNARVGDLAAVEDDLNVIGQHRITGYVDLPEYTDRATALADVKTERRRELMAKGVRLFDLKRYNAFDNANISLTRTIEGTTYTLEPNSNRWIVPLTRSLLQLDPGLEQSPR